MFGVKLTIEGVKMNRQEALEWLVANRTSWPTCTMFMSVSCWSFWKTTVGDIVFAENGQWGRWPDEEGSTAEIITQADWLAATDDMPKQDCESVFE